MDELWGKDEGKRIWLPFRVLCTEFGCGMFWETSEDFFTLLWEPACEQSEKALIPREVTSVPELQYYTWTEQLLHSEKNYQIPTLPHASSNGPFNPYFPL